MSYIHVQVDLTGIMDEIDTEDLERELRKRKANPASAAALEDDDLLEEVMTLLLRKDVHAAIALLDRAIHPMRLPRIKRQAEASQ